MVVAKNLNIILKQYEKKQLSHSFLLDTNNIESCINDIKQILMVINCPKTYENNCQSDCNLCKLIEIGNLPSIVRIDPDGANIKRGQLEELENKFSLKPIYSKYNAYLIVEADKMNNNAANTILKFLEEPADNIIGFLITKNSNEILPTIKSRCEIIKVIYNEDQSIDQEIASMAEEYIDKIMKKNDYLINKDLLNKVNNDRNTIYQIVTYLFNVYYEKLENNLKNNININNELKIIDVLKKGLKLIKYNVNLELTLDDLVIEMRQLND